MTLFLYEILPSFSIRFAFCVCLIVVTILLALLLFYLKKKIIIIILSIFIFGSFLSVNGLIRENYQNKITSFNNKNVIITGKITSNFSYTKSENIKIIIDDVKIFSEDNYLKLNKKYYLYIEPSNLNTNDLKLGSYVETNAIINMYDFNKDNKSQISNDIAGYSFCYSNDFVVKEKFNLNLREKIVDFVYKKLIKFDLRTAGIGLAMIFGNVDFIEKDTVTAFQNIGVAHLLAVSGLNVSIIISIFMFICKKLRFSLKSQFIVNLVILPIYMYLCNFSPSVVRAGLMAIILLYAKMRGKPYDRLNALSLVSCLMILINPLYVYNYSFILSFASTFAIIMLYLKFKLFFGKYFYNYFADELSLNLSIQVSLIFIQLYLFGYLPFLSILSNLFIIPLVSISFIILLIGFVISLIPIFSFGLIIYDFLMNIVVELGYFINSLGSIITIPNIAFISVLLYFVFIFVISDYFFEKRNNKIFIVINLIFICFIAQTLIIM